MAEPKVEYNFLGKCGVKVSNLCLGTMTFGKDENMFFFDSPRQADEELSHQILDVYASSGGNFIDTADIYSKGKSEEVVGNWLSKHDRSKFVLASKVFCPMDGSNPNSVGLSRRHIIEGCERSLERLKTNYIDLYQSHIWDAATPIDETLRTFDDLIRCGKVRYYGASNVCGWQLQKLVCRLEAMGLNSCVSLQQHYNLLVRQSELDEFMVCHNEGIGVLTWSPLKGGLLTGKYKREEGLEASGSRLGYGQSKNKEIMSTPAWDKYTNNEGYWKLMDVLSEIATVHGKTIPQVVIRWLLQKNIVTSVIIGVTSVKQLEDNLGAAKGWELSDEEMKRLDETSVRLDLYPHEMIWKANSGRYNPFNRAYQP